MMQDCMEAMAKRMEEHLQRLERLHLPEYIAYLDNRRRFFLTQLLGGLFRGMGMAIGFTLLGAALVLLLKGLAERNLPVIGDFLAELLSIVQGRME